MIVRRIGITAALLSIAFAKIAHADPSTSDKVIAESLFAEGKRAMAAGHNEDACDKFAASYSMVNKLGTLLNLATCNESVGKTASAWIEFKEARAMADAAGQTDRANLAREAVARMEPKLSHIRVTWETGDRVEGATITLGDTSIPLSAVGTAIVFDPGTYQMKVLIPNRGTRYIAVTIPGGSTVNVQIPSDQPSPTYIAKQPALPPMLTPNPPPPSERLTPPPIDHSKTSPWKVAGYVGVIGGGAALAGGLIAGVVAMGQKSHVNQDCNGLSCSQAGFDAVQSGRSAANVSTALILAGSAIAASGAMILLLDRSGRTRVGGSWLPGYAGINVVQAF
jgi:hypothetical protein